MSHSNNDQVGPLVLVQSNEKDQNQLLTFRRDPAGTLGAMDSVLTGGTGNGTPHLPSQGSVKYSGDERFAFVTNAGSGDMSLFAVTDGQLRLVQTARTGGSPSSVAERDGLIYVLNTGDASLTALILDGSTLSPLSGPPREWDPQGQPAQVGFTPDGRHLVVTERGANRIIVFPVESSGLLGEPTFHPSSGITPYGFGFTPNGALVVTEAFGGEPTKSALSSYTITNSSLSPASRSVGNGHTALCWAVISPDGQFAYAANFGDGAVSRYDITSDASLTLGTPTLAVAGGGSPGLRDLDLSRDGRFLYAIDADAGTLVGWALDGLGRATQIGCWSGLPLTMAGIAAI